MLTISLLPTGCGIHYFQKLREKELAGHGGRRRQGSRFRQGGGQDAYHRSHAQISWACPEAAEPSHRHHRPARLPGEVDQPGAGHGQQVRHRGLPHHQRGSADCPLHLREVFSGV